MIAQGKNVDVRVTSHNKCSVGTGSHDLANHLGHQFTTTSIATNEKAGDVSRILNTLDSNILRTAHHLSNGGNEWWARNTSHIAKLRGAASKKNGHCLTATTVCDIVLSGRSQSR